MEQGTVDMKELGAKLRELRELRGMTYDEVGVRAGVAGRTVRRIENAEVEPRLPTFVDICTAMGVDPAKLLGARP